MKDICIRFRNEVLQEIPGVHARPREKTTTWGWFQEAQEDLEEVQGKFAVSDRP